MLIIAQERYWPTTRLYVDGVTARGGDSKWVDQKGDNADNKSSLMPEGVHTREGLRSDTNLFFHSHAILPVMVKSTPDVGHDNNDLRLAVVPQNRCRKGN